MKRPLQTLYLLLCYLFFYFPIAIVVIYSFNNATYSMLWHGFTTQWYAQLAQDTDIITVTWHSIIIGVCASTAAALIGTLTATCLFRYRFFGKQILYALIFILIISPDIVMGISLLLLYSIFKIPLGFWTLLLSHITFCIPFVTVIVYSRMSSLNKHIFEAAKDLGANDFTIFKNIIIPLMWPAILAGWLLSFTMSLDDVVISYFVTGPSFQILPLQIYSMVRLGVKPEINALCTVLLAVTLLIVIISQMALRRNKNI